MLIFVFSALIVVLDQFIKHYIVRTLEIGERGPEIIPGILGLTRWENDGAMLNILSGQQWLLAGIAFVVSIALVMILLRYNDGFWGSLGLASVLGGAIGNLVDRVFNDGAVVDMFRTLFISFPIFNIADIFITLGFATFLVHFIALSIREAKGEKAHVEGDEYDDEEYYEENYENDYSQQGQNQGYDEFPDTGTIIPPQAHHQADVAQGASYQQYGTPDMQPTIAEYPPNEVYTPQSPQVTQSSEQHYAPTQPHYEPENQHIPKENYQSPYQSPYQPTEHAYTQTDMSQSEELDSTTDVTPDFNYTYDELGLDLDLDIDFSNAEDYDVDALLREYGIDDDV
ncbi:MAG: signal peptidase II [Oscillospiraceae bacterium]|nr:signal peptidase II [Oscillospiraceae bacterium]